MKKRICLFLTLLVALGGAFPAQAELKTWEQEGDSPATFCRLTTWQGELPPLLGDVLAQRGYGNLPCLAGAMGETVYTQSQEVDSIRALVALQGESGPIALGMAYGSTYRQWFLDDMGDKAFLPGREYALQIIVDHRPINRFAFALDYAGPQGGMERYELMDGYGENQPWILRRYSAWDSRGKGVEIAGASPEHGFRVRSLPAREEDQGVLYPGFIRQILRYMPGGVGEYPATREEAQRMAKESLRLFEGKNLAILYGANLRKEPTARSQSLGKAQPGALAEVLGQKPGKDYPWFHLRLGNVECYVAGNYVHPIPQPDVFAADPLSLRVFAIMPPPVVRAREACALRQSPGGSGKEAARLEAGTQMHVLSVTSDGYYQVMVPRDEPDWYMDVEGTSGYVKGAEVEGVSGMVWE
ncbi:MAG: SH3 domain-containing protein [Candidatus Limiplasma sp.]|nr:SH3 domain-containing protein [Candidatus Limiplasma sp.]